MHTLNSKKLKFFNQKLLSLCRILLQLKKHFNAVKQSRRFNKEQIKKQLLDSFVYNEIDKEGLSARADTVKDCQEAVKIIKERENMIKTNRKSIMHFAYEQDKIFNC